MAGLKHVLRWLWEGRGGFTTLSSTTRLLDDVGGYSTASGITVTPDKAMQLSAVSACVRLIAESIASLPLHVYQHGGEKRTRVDDGVHYRLLHTEPNQLMSSFGFRETLAASVLLWGNAYAFIRWSEGGDPVELLPLLPESVQPFKTSAGRLGYTFSMDGVTQYRVDQSAILHVPGLAYDGICGMSPIRYAAQSVGLGLAAERYGASWFGNGSQPSGYLTMQEKLNPEQTKTLRDQWYAAYGGLSNANRTAVLFNGAKFEKISIPPNEAQFVETRKFQVSEIARWYRVPPHMIGDLDKATFSNIEHQALEFVTHTLRPWLVRFEQEINRKLFIGTYADQYAEFNVDGLLRGDVKSRGDYYVRGRQWGWLSANDIRRLENMEPIDGGDVYLTPLNMVNAGTTPATDASQEPA